MVSHLPKMKVLSILARNYYKLDIELFHNCSAFNAKFLYRMLHWANTGLKRVFGNKYAFGEGQLYASL